MEKIINNKYYIGNHVSFFKLLILIPLLINIKLFSQSNDTVNVYFRYSNKYIFRVPCKSLINCNERIRSLNKSNDTLFLTYNADTIRDSERIRGAGWAIESYIVIKENEKMAIRIPLDLDVDSVNQLIIKYVDNVYFFTRKKDTFILNPKLSNMGKRNMLRIYYRRTIIKTFKFFGYD